jgi:peptidyl-prolyl cis-trans isomerase D
LHDAAGVAAPDTYSDVVVAYLGERRSFSWLEITASTLPSPVPEPTDTQLRTYFDANPDNYVLPAAKALTYAWLLPDQIADQIEVPEDDLRALYDERDSEFNIPERRLVERIVFAPTAEAQTALDSINSGDASFEDVVAARGLTLADVDMGLVTRASLGDAADTVFSLTNSGITATADTALGPGFYRINAILAPRTTPFEDVRAELLDEASADAARRLVTDQIADFDDLLAGGATLEELARETDMQLGQIDWVQPTDDGIAAYDGFNDAAAQITASDFPSIQILADGGIFALRLDELIPERPDTFENAREQVIIDWTVAETSSALTAEADRLMASLAGGASLSSLGLPVNVETNVKRDAAYPDNPPGFVDQVFEMTLGETATVADDSKIVLCS